MSYRIYYQPNRKNRRKVRFPARRAVLTAMFFALFLVCNVYPDFNSTVKDAMASLRTTAVVSLMDDLAAVFQDGGKLSAVVECFVQHLTAEEPFASG